MKNPILPFSSSIKKIDNTYEIQIENQLKRIYNLNVFINTPKRFKILC